MARKTFIDISTTIAYFLDVNHVFEENGLARYIINCNNIIEASKRLNELNVLTELNIEEELYRLYISQGLKISPEDYVRVVQDLKCRFKRSITN